MSSTYRWLLRLYPAPIRRADGEAMLETIETRLRAASSLRQRLVTQMRETLGLLAGAVAARLRPRRPAHLPPGSPRPMNGLLHDLRYACRLIVREPGYSAVVVTTLALGIGANVAIFSVVQGVLLRPLPYFESDRLVRMSGGGETVTKALHARLRVDMESVADLSAYTGWGFTVGGTEDPEVVSGGLVSTNWFDLLGARPALGRAFLPDDARPGNDDVAVLSWDLWQRRFGGDPEVIGRRVPIDNDQHPTRIVIGVMPAAHRPIEDWGLWVPYRFDVSDREDAFSSWYLQLVGRRVADRTPVEVATELRERLELLAADERYGIVDPAKYEQARALELQEYLVGPVRGTLRLLFSAVGLVLLIACSNVANLQLARARVRRRELGVRAAVGAPRGRLIRQLTIEALVLAGVGAALGVGGATLSLGLLRARLAGALPRIEAVTIDGGVIAFTAGLAVATALLFGIVPALWLLRSGIREEGSRGSEAGAGSGRASRALVVAEVALACIVVVAAGLMVRTSRSLWSVALGFDPEPVGVARAIAPSARYADGPAQTAFWGEAVERLNAAPEIERAAAIHLLPLRGGNWSFPFQPEGFDSGGEQVPLPLANFRIVTPGYFDTMGVRLLSGRDFDGRDGAEDAAVVIVNHRLAETMWPDEPAVGKRLDLFGSIPLTVVGVVDNVRQHRLEMEPLMEMYRPLAQWPAASLVVVTRSADPTRAPAVIERVLHQIDPAVPVFEGATMEAVMAESISSTRLTVTLLTGFAALALLLGAVGVYGVMSYLVTRRTREIGIRIALGAQAPRVRRGMVIAALQPVALGILTGLAASIAVSRLLVSLLYGVEPIDPPTYALVALALVAVGLVAGWLPARRAARVDPLRALRVE